MMFCPQVSSQELRGGQDLLLKAIFRGTMQEREEVETRKELSREQRECNAKGKRARKEERE